MGKGFWYGDQPRGGRYRGEIKNLILDSDGNLTFDYSYSSGATGGGQFKGFIADSCLQGAWNEICDERPRAGVVQLNRGEPVELQDRFEGWFYLVRPSPSEADDDRHCTIEFDL